MKLTQGMFGTEFGRQVETPFNLHTGQMRTPDMVHNGGWYNIKGERIGWGDLSPTDFLRIQRHLDTKDAFIVMGESESFWSFVTKVGIIGSMSKTTPTIDNPGLDYVMENCMFVITKSRVHAVLPEWEEHREPFTKDGATFHYVPREEIKKLLTSLSKES